MSLKHFKRTNEWRASNVTVSTEEVTAFSYHWWQFARQIGNIRIFNYSHYSPSTSRHQWKAWSKFDECGVKFDLVLRHTDKTLKGDIFIALDAEIEGLQKEMNILTEAINRPRSHKAKNVERRYDIGKLEQIRREVESFKNRLKMYLVA